MREHLMLLIEGLHLFIYLNTLKTVCKPKMFFFLYVCQNALLYAVFLSKSYIVNLLQSLKILPYSAVSVAG